MASESVVDTPNGRNRSGNLSHTLLERFAPLHLVYDTPKGRGIVAAADIPKGTVLDVSPVLILDPNENAEHIEKTSLYHYTYNWPRMSSDGRLSKTQAVVFGLGSMFNHSTQNQNVGWQRDLDRQAIVYRALRDVRCGEELCISYGDHLTFQDADKVTQDAVEESGLELLGMIEIDV